MGFLLPGGGDDPSPPVGFGYFRVYLDGDLAWLVMDREGKSENTIGAEFPQSVEQAVAYLTEHHAAGRCRVCILTSAKRRFCVGADINEFFPLTDEDQILALVLAGKAALRLIERLPMPTVAAINGDALGGGLELALVCDYRVAPASPRCRLGFPEVMLGVLPGLGGTVRFPRLVGLQPALTFLLTGKHFTPATARTIGLVDALLPDPGPDGNDQQFFETVRLYASEAALRGKPAPNRRTRDMADWFLTQTPIGRHIVTSRTLRSINVNTKGGRYPAPYLAFGSIMAALCETDTDRALAAESAAFATACSTAQCKALMGLFFWQEHAKKLDAHRDHFVPEDVSPAATAVGILGAGEVARTLAYLALRGGLSVVLLPGEEAAGEDGGRLLTAVDRMFGDDVRARRTIPEAQRSAALRCRLAASLEDLRPCGIVVDTTPHPAQQRPDLWGSALATGTVVAVTHDLFDADLSELPGLVGLHFFHPIGKVPLVEIVRGPGSSAKALATAYKLALDLGKVPVVVPAAPGFLVNRLMAFCFAEAGQLLEDGATPEQVDRALEAFGMTAGPFRWADAMGFAAVVALHNAVRRSAGESLPSPPLLDAMAAHPDHGAAAGHGFYRYSSAGKPPEPDHDTHALLGVKRRRMPPDTREVVDRCVLSMANAACRLLATANPPLPAADLDAALALAVGFAPWRGGLLSYVDSRGLPDTIAALTDLAGRCGYRFSPDPLLTQMAERGDIFFPDRPRTLPPDPGPPSVCVDYFANRRVTRYFLAALPILLAVAYELIMRILRLF